MWLAAGRWSSSGNYHGARIVHCRGMGGGVGCMSLSRGGGDGDCAREDGAGAAHGGALHRVSASAERGVVEPAKVRVVSSCGDDDVGAWGGGAAGVCDRQKIPGRYDGGDAGERGEDDGFEDRW